MGSMTWAIMIPAAQDLARVFWNAVFVELPTCSPSPAAVFSQPSAFVAKTGPTWCPPPPRPPSSERARPAVQARAAPSETDTSCGESKRTGLKQEEREENERGDDLRSRNPLLQQGGLPKFESISPEASREAFDVLLNDVENGLGEFEADLVDFRSKDSWLKRGMKHDYMGVVERMEHLRAPLDYAWGVMSHLKNVADSRSLREAYQELQPKVLAVLFKLGQSEEVRSALEFLQGPAAKRAMSEAEVRAVDELLGKMVVCKDEEAKAAAGEMNEILLELGDLSRAFTANVLDATKAYGLTLADERDVDGLTDADLALAAWSAKAAGAANATLLSGPWRFTLDAPSIFPCMERMESREVRERLYRAYVTRASSLSRGGGASAHRARQGGNEDSPPLRDDSNGGSRNNESDDNNNNNNNEPLIERILELRKRMAELLGHESYAECSVPSEVAGSVDDVCALLSALRDKSYPAAQRELEGLRAFANEKGHVGDLALWDVRFWGRRQAEDVLKLSDREDLRVYFPLPKVLEGMFGLAERLFGVSVVPADGQAEVWHPDVRFFTVRNSSFGDDSHLASFYLDPYSRPEGKRGGGAWTDPFMRRSRALGRSPVVFLNCNFPPPVEGGPCLLAFKDVVTLFHEFGHSLQYMLTKVDVNFAGINEVAWDAVELPSMFMENWCYHKPTVDRFASHYETGEPLPSDRSDELRLQQTHLAGYKMLQNLYLGQLDLELHHRYEPTSGEETVFDVQRAVAERFMVVPPMPEDRSLCTACHIFAGGYAARHYSYTCSEVMSADAFAAFEEAGLGDEEAISKLGRLFADTVLAMGGSRDALKVFREFRGRGPTPDALLRHRGL